MNQLWAPWRLAYVAADKSSAEAGRCFLCDGLVDADDRGRLIVHRGRECFVILNRYPYNNGHVLVAPNRHKGKLDQLSTEEIVESQQLLARLVEIFDALMKPDGYNIGLNLGKAAGAGLPGHLHWHLVPRWEGDTNFMPVIADVKVIVQSLDATYELLASRLR